jgi:23S rRNA pseudouridine1911/1915/1917 synthase
MPARNRSTRSHRPDANQSPQPPEELIEALGDVGEEDVVVGPLEPEFAEDEGAEHRRYILAKDAKRRLDKYLQNRVKGISRNQIQKLIALGGVTVNGKVPKASTNLRRGDLVDVILPPRPATDLKAEPIPLDVLYEDHDFIVINKQANLIVHPARSHLSGTLLNALAYHFAHHSADGGQLSSVGAEGARPGVVHRLDKNTTGVIIVAKRDETHWLLAKQFEQRTNLKVYLAVVHGCPDPPAGAIDAPIGKHPTIREAMAIRHDSQGKDSVTLYRVRERYRGYSLVELELKSGRTHQIRVHLSYLGHPVVGDIIYGGEPIGEHELVQPPLPAGYRPNLTFARDKAEGQRLEALSAAREDLIIASPALHAALLQIVHPVTEQTMTFTAALHSPMKELVHRLREQREEGPVAEKGYWIDLEKAVPEAS